MDDASAATPTSHRVRYWRHPWLAPGAPLLVLAVLTVNVLTDGPLVGADQTIRRAVLAQARSARWRWLYPPAQQFVDLGKFGHAVPALAVTALVLAIGHRSLRPLLAAGTGVVLLAATVVPAKILIGRPGPGQTSLGPGHAGIAPGSWGVFPSGHTATACVCYGLAVLLLAPDLPTRIRRVVLSALVVLCFLVGAALMWLDLHWFTDVAAGWALAAIIVQLALRTTRVRSRPAEARSVRPADSPASTCTQ